MSQRFEVVDVTCPATIPPGAPVEVPLPFDGGVVRRITVVIPDGHAGTTGIALAYGHQRIIPRSAGAYISGNDESIRIDYTDTVPGVQWSALVCNGDLQPHSWEVRFELDELPDAKPAASPAPPTTADIVAAGNAALAEQ